MTQNILVCFGGESAEHEVSIITGLQVLEEIDRMQFNPHALYINKIGIPFLIPGLSSRKDFYKLSHTEVVFGKDKKGGYLETTKLLKKKIYPDCAYLAFHGGTGECGPFQGLMELLNIPYTSPSQESAVLTMNKALTKALLRANNISVVDGVNITSKEVLQDSLSAAQAIIKSIPLPLIIKPAHLGSSIGIAIAKSGIELEKHLLTAAHLDSEIVVEKFLSNFVEYNCAVRSLGNTIQTSEIERPLNKDEVLSFADKYERGRKKTSSGMASLDRELPAKITPELENKIRSLAILTYETCRCKGNVRIDFLVADGVLYFNEVNPIPGSMAFYLWEANGISFQTQIAELIDQSIEENKTKTARNLDYSTSIVQSFIANS
jgi:D-alanine-D-alanine ligase